MIGLWYYKHTSFKLFDNDIMSDKNSELLVDGKK